MKVKEAKELFEDMFKGRGINDNDDVILKVVGANLNITINKLRVEVTRDNKEVMTGITKLE